jgi:hypothetical protein
MYLQLKVHYHRQCQFTTGVIVPGGGHILHDVYIVLCYNSSKFATAVSADTGGKFCRRCLQRWR